VRRPVVVPFLLSALLAAGLSHAGTAEEVGRDIGQGSRKAVEVTKEAGKSVANSVGEFGKDFWEGLKDFGHGVGEGWQAPEKKPPSKPKVKEETILQKMSRERLDVP